MVQHDTPISTLPPSMGLAWDVEVEGLTTSTVYVNAAAIPFPPQYPMQGVCCAVWWVFFPPQVCWL